MKRISVFASVLLAVSLLGAGVAAREPDIAAVKEKGFLWLKGNQKENGSWSDENYPALTALGLWAIAGSGREDMAEASAKAADFVAGFAQENGGIYKVATGGRGSGGLSTYNTAICMVALNEYDKVKFAPIILKAREFMVGAQVKGDSPGAGGFGYGVPGENPRDRPDLSNTGWALMAMRNTQGLEDLRQQGGKQAEINWEAALNFVEALQIKGDADEDELGGFAYESAGARGGTATDKEGAVTLRGFGSMTYAGLESMIYARVGLQDERVQSAITWAGRHWSVEENPGMGTRGLYYYYTIMAKSLSLLGDAAALRNPAGKPVPWKADLVSKLAATQREDGSWANDNNMFWEADPALVTSYALLVLNYVSK